jgi:CBS domain-containing protein
MLGTRSHPGEPMEKKVAHILDRKGRDVWTIEPDASVLDALRLMADKNVGALVVADESGLRGIISERDYARKVVLLGRSSQDARVADIMTAEVITTASEQPVERCMETMYANKIRHLPVVDGGRLAGLVSIGDVVGAVIDKQESMIEQLERYITGG